MDKIISAALEEVCVRGASGIRLLELWPNLQASISSSSLELSDVVKKVIWGRLASHPGLGFMVSGSSMQRKDVLQGSVDEMEKIGLTIVAEEHLRDSFMGLYDLKQSPHFEISQIQKRVLERLAMARTTGVTQSELAKELNIKGTNFYYVVRNLVSQQLIVKQSTMVREKESRNVENGPKHDQIVNTNLLHLSRYAKNVNLNPQQRIEITRSVWPPMLNESGDTECTVPIGGFEDCLREDVHIKDFIPAMKAICEKLEATKNKVDVVSSIKLSLGYRKTTGHRAWRNILFRLKCAGLVEEFQAEVNGKDVSCLRLLKEFDPKYFQPKAFMHGCRGSDSENLVRSGKRGQITDQLVEVPLDNQIYDMIDAEGQRGITILELSRRLGINLKKLHKRVMSVCEKFGVVARSEIHNKQQVHRFWTLSSHLQNPIESFSDDQNRLSDGHDLSNQVGDSVPFDRPLVSKSEHELLVSEERNRSQDLKIGSSFCGPIYEVIESEQEPDDRANKDNFMADNVKLDEASCNPDSCVAASTSLQSISVSSIPILQTQKYACRSSSLFSALREQRILEKLEDEKFILKVELHKWLEDIEKDKPTTMDRKTLDRSLKKLQESGFCRCIGVHMPSLTNFKSLRYTEAILHPSVNPSQELIQQIYEKQRSFDVRCRRSGFGKIKVERPVVELPQLKNVERSSTHVDGSKAMIKNGFVLAKMVRVKLLHKFLWSHLSSSPYWQNASKFSRKGTVNVTNPAEDCQLFSLDAAVKEMPLELFLQVAGSKLVIDNLERKCKLGLKLSDLSVQERRCLLDTQATSRLSSIVEILYRLRLIQLVNKGAVQDVNLLSHALELQPYLEEPMPAVLPSSDINRSDNCYKLRHDFILSDNEVVDRYWETLEYCFAVADPSYSRQCFPGSHVDEVFHRRSWSSVRVMTTEQRLKLLKYVKTDDQTNKIPFSKCVKISRELNLTLEQVLRVCYDNRQTHHAEHFNHLKYEGWEQNDDPNIIGAVPRKMRRLSNHTLHDHTQNVPPGELDISGEKSSFKFDEEAMHLDSCSPPAAVHVRSLQACRADEQSPIEVQVQPREESEAAALITKCAFNELKPSRKRKFSWTDNSDRKLVMQYARHRAMLGARFSRVDWPSLCDLPAQPNTCKRRMATLNQNSNIRRAVLRLCNLLGERYTRYLDNSRNKADQKSTDIDNFEKIDESVMLCDTVHDSASCVNIYKSNFQHDRWDNFENSELRMALDEVLKYKRLAKKEDARSVGGRPEGERTHNPLSDNLNFTYHEPENCSASSCAGGVLHDSDKKDPAKIAVSSAADQNKLNNYSSRGKFFKFRAKGNLSQIYKSLSIANAIELLKLVFLSFSKNPGVQNLLARTLQKYPQGDIFAAFNYLREKNYLVVGHGSRPFVLSRKFFHDLSSSPFSNDSGKRATNFSNWLQKQKNDLMQDGVAIPPDLQCGEISHLFSLVLCGEILVSPCLPNCGIGEADELRTSESFSSWGEVGDIGASKNLKHTADASHRSEKVERSKLPPNADGDRREKGFPGIKVFLKMESVMAVDDFECLGYEKDSIHAFTGDSASVEETCLTSSSDNVDMIHEMDSPSSCWDGMSRYVEYLASRSGITNAGIPSSTDFKSVHSIICEAGEQGVSMEEISEALKIKGEMVAEMVADTLEVFRLAAKVNAFDSIRVVDASHAYKYFIRVPNHGKIHKQVNDILSCTKSQETCSETAGGPFQEHHEKVDNCLFTQSGGLYSESKENACSRSNNPRKYCIEGEPFGENANLIEESRNDQSFHVQENVVGSVRNPVGGMEGGFQPILPWISGDGNINLTVYKGLTRRVLGIVMQNPCILEEDIIAKMDVLNPQSCRRLLETMVLDNHITVRRMHQTATPAPPPTILQSLFPSNLKRPALNLRKHYFANPMSSRML